MADINHLQIAPAHTEGDGINYPWLGWFVVILVVTTVTCQLLMWAFLRFEMHRNALTDTPRSALAAPAGQAPPPPRLLTDEPANLQQYEQQEHEVLSTYGWVDRNAGTIHIPISVAKQLLLQRGLPARSANSGSPQGTTEVRRNRH
jgi:hypothetical protein